MDQLDNFKKENETTTPPNDTTSSKTNWYDALRLLFFSGIIIGLDQWTKSLVLKNLPFLDSWLPERLSGLAPYARIVHWHNSGAAFGMFQNGNLVIMVLAIIASLFIIYYFPQIEKEEWPIRLAMIFQLAGALGNLIDRIRFGYVIDFISVGNFPVFNVADSSITIGVAILIIGIIIEELKDRKNSQHEEENEGSTNLEESSL